MVSQNITLKWSWSCRGKARRPDSVATGHPTDAKGHLLNPSTRLWRQRCMYTNRRSVLKVASKPHSCNTQNTRQPYLIWPVVNNMFIDFFLTWIFANKSTSQSICFCIPSGRNLRQYLPNNKAEGYNNARRKQNCQNIADVTRGWAQITVWTERTVYRVWLKRRSFDNYCNPTPLTRSDNEIDTFLASAAIGATTAASAKAGHSRVTRRSTRRNQVARHGSLFCVCVQRTPPNQIPTKTVPVYFCARRDVCASQGRNQTSPFQYGAT